MLPARATRAPSSSGGGERGDIRGLERPGRARTGEPPVLKEQDEAIGDDAVELGPESGTRRRCRMDIGMGGAAPGLKAQV